MRHFRPSRARAALAAALAFAALIPSASRAAPSPSGPVELTLVSYAVAKPLFAKVIPEFQRAWRAQTGQEVRFKESYGPSGAQTRSIVGGLEADVYATNLQSLVAPLVEAGLVTRGLGEAPAERRLAGVLGHRGHHPRRQPEEDPGLGGPRRAGGRDRRHQPEDLGNARWGVLAGYGAVLREKDAKAAEAWVQALVRNTKILASGGREATDAFVKNGVGDALLTFENEALFASKASGEPIEYVVPP